MKKSECFRMAQIAVIESTNIMAKVKLDILEVLMAAESLERFVEKQREEETGAE